MEFSLFIGAMILSFAVFFIPKNSQHLSGLLLHFIPIITTNILAIAVLFFKVSSKLPVIACNAPNRRMQFSGKSFSKSLSKMFNFILIEEKKYKKQEAGVIFPKNRKFASYYYNFIENRFIDFNTHQLVFAVNNFKFVQNGRV